jgi:hypothetical protein
MTPRELAEYTALRATIQERGTTRIWVVLVGLVAWTALAVATGTLAVVPIATLLPLFVLAVTFELVFALRTDAERIGRYVQVFFEDREPGWEHRIMAFAAQRPSHASDPLFSSYFWIATVLNAVPAASLGPAPVEWLVIGAAHVLFGARVAVARQQAAEQRARDLERFTQMKEPARGPGRG